jgi:short-subunit dehydrogenase
VEIKNRHVLITGASRGIGRSFARVCAADKSHLHLVLRKFDSEIQGEMMALGAKSVTIHETDLAKKASLDRLCEVLPEHGIDIVFNNAGLVTGGLLEKQSAAEIATMMQVNVNALIQLTHAVLPGMLKRKRGKIVNNASVLAYMHLPFTSTYTASKAAVAAFTECLKMELKDTGVSTLLLVTPAVRTKLLDDIDVIYGEKLKLPTSPLAPQKYAEMIREAVLEDVPVLEPSGFAGLGLKVAQYVPRLFNIEINRRFRR